MSAYNKSNVIKPEQEAMDEVNNMDISIEIKNLQLPKENEQLPKQEQMVNIVTDEDEFKSAKSKIIQSCNDSSIMMSSYNQIGDSFKKNSIVISKTCLIQAKTLKYKTCMQR